MPVGPVLVPLGKPQRAGLVTQLLPPVAVGEGDGDDVTVGEGVADGLGLGLEEGDGLADADELGLGEAFGPKPVNVQVKL
jgi:hypothetical protein